MLKLEFLLVLPQVLQAVVLGFLLLFGFLGRWSIVCVVRVILDIGTSTGQQTGHLVLRRDKAACRSEPHSQLCPAILGVRPQTEVSQATDAHWRVGDILSRQPELAYWFAD